MLLIATVPRVFPCPAKAIKTEYSLTHLALELFKPSLEIILSVSSNRLLLTSPDDIHGISFGSQYSRIEVFGVPPVKTSVWSPNLRCSQASVNPSNLI